MLKLTPAILVLALSSLLTQGCFRQEVQTLIVNVPQLNSESCGKIITDRLLQVSGIRSAVVDVENKQVSVEFLSTIVATKNIEFVIAGVGFDANDRKAEPAARENLPEGCR